MFPTRKIIADKYASFINASPFQKLSNAFYEIGTAISEAWNAVTPVAKVANASLAVSLGVVDNVIGTAIVALESAKILKHNIDYYQADSDEDKKAAQANYDADVANLQYGLEWNKAGVDYMMDGAAELYNSSPEAIDHLSNAAAECIVAAGNVVGAIVELSANTLYGAYQYCAPVAQPSMLVQYAPQAALTTAEVAKVAEPESSVTVEDITDENNPVMLPKYVEVEGLSEASNPASTIKSSPFAGGCAA